jgi:hypothetical protein
MMKTPVVLVAAVLTVAILLTTALLIATGTRGEEGKAVIGEVRPQYLTMSSPATGSRECAPDDRLRRVTQYSRGASD